MKNFIHALYYSPLFLVSSLQAATKQYVDKGGLKLVTGSYVGNGRYGSSNPNTILCSFEPYVLSVFPYQDGVYGDAIFGFKNFDQFGYAYNRGPITWENDRVLWYTTRTTSLAAQYQLNISGITYPYLIIGK